MVDPAGEPRACFFKYGRDVGVLPAEHTDAEVEPTGGQFAQRPKEQFGVFIEFPPRGPKDS